MSSLKEQLQAKRWANNLYDAAGTLRDNYRYAVARTKALCTDRIVLIVRGSAIERKAPYLDELVEHLGQMAHQAHKEVIVYAWKGFWDTWLATSPHLQCRPHNDPEKPEVLANAGTLCILGYMPNYVIRREGQRIVQVWAEPEGLSPQHSIVARGFTSQLLSTSHIVAQSQQDMDRVLDAYRMRSLYAGDCLVWNGMASFAQQVATLVAEGAARELMKVPPTYSKRRVLIYARLKDSAAYPQLMLRMVLSFDYSRYDVTLALSRQPSADQRASLDKLPAELRIICRTGRFSLTPQDYITTQLDMEALQDGGSYASRNLSCSVPMAQGELSRLFGSSSFDSFVYCGESSALWYQLAEALPCPRKVKVVCAQAFTPQTAKTDKYALPFQTDREACQEIFDALYADDVRVLKDAGFDEGTKELGTYALAYDIEGALDTCVYHENASVEGRASAFLGQAVSSMRLHGSLLPLPEQTNEAFLVDAAGGDAEELVRAVDAYASNPWECVVVGTCPEAVMRHLADAYPGCVRFAGSPQHLSVYCNTAELYVRHFSAYVADARLSPNDLRTAADNKDLAILLFEDGRLRVADEHRHTTKDDIRMFMRGQAEEIAG